VARFTAADIGRTYILHVNVDGGSFQVTGTLREITPTPEYCFERLSPYLSKDDRQLYDPPEPHDAVTCFAEDQIIECVQADD
jgi:hypothetical protein